VVQNVEQLLKSVEQSLFHYWFDVTISINL